MTTSYYDMANISITKALEAVQEAINIAATMGVKASVSVVDRSMNLIAFAKADGATPHGTETSRKKANTAASTGKATGWMSAEIALTLPLASDNQLTNIWGGLPLIFEGKLVGGLWVAGGTVDQDKEIASKTIKNIGGETANI